MKRRKIVVAKAKSKKVNKKVNKKIKPAKPVKAKKAKIVAKPKISAKMKPVMKPVVQVKKAKAVTVKTPTMAITKNSAKNKTEKNTLNWDKFVTPLDDRIFVLDEKRAEKTPGGLFIPDSAEAVENNQGTVVVAGRGHLDKKGKIHPLDVKNGDRVLYPKHSGNRILINGSELLVLRESDVLGVVD
jgi:chaperonin GroES